MSDFFLPNGDNFSWGFFINLVSETIFVNYSAVADHVSNPFWTLAALLAVAFTQLVIIVQIANHARRTQKRLDSLERQLCSILEHANAPETPPPIVVAVDLPATTSPDAQLIAVSAKTTTLAPDETSLILLETTSTLESEKGKDSASPITPEQIVSEFQQVIARTGAQDEILARWHPQIVEVKNSQNLLRSLGEAPLLAVVQKPETETYYWLVHQQGGSGFLVPSPAMHRARVHYLTPDGLVMGSLFDGVFNRTEGASFGLDMPAQVTVDGDQIIIQALGRIIVPFR